MANKKTRERDQDGEIVPTIYITIRVTEGERATLRGAAERYTDGNLSALLRAAPAAWDHYWHVYGPEAVERAAGEIDVRAQWSCFERHDSREEAEHHAAQLRSNLREGWGCKVVGSYNGRGDVPGYTCVGGEVMPLDTP